MSNVTIPARKEEGGLRLLGEDIIIYEPIEEHLETIERYYIQNGQKPGFTSLQALRYMRYIAVSENVRIVTNELDADGKRMTKPFVLKFDEVLKLPTTQYKEYGAIADAVFKLGGVEFTQDGKRVEVDKDDVEDGEGNTASDIEVKKKVASEKQ